MKFCEYNHAVDAAPHKSKDSSYSILCKSPHGNERTSETFDFFRRLILQCSTAFSAMRQNYCKRDFRLIGFAFMLFPSEFCLCLFTVRIDPSPKQPSIVLSFAIRKSMIAILLELNSTNTKCTKCMTQKNNWNANSLLSTCQLNHLQYVLCGATFEVSIS